MKIGSISENTNLEKRVAITPDIVKKYKSLGLEVCLNKDYALHLGFEDKAFEAEGATIYKNQEQVILNSDAILQMNISSSMGPSSGENLKWIVIFYFG